MSSEAPAGGLANVRDAAWLRYPRHDNSEGTGHPTGTWAPKYHVSIAHPVKGESWSACGTAFLIEGGIPLAEVPPLARCQRPGCRERWPPPSATPVDAALLRERGDGGGA